MTSSRDKNVITIFFHIADSLLVSSNLYLQNLGSEIALSIMVQEFTCLQNGLFLGLSVTPVSIYVSIVAFTSNFTSIGAGKCVTGNARSRIYMSIFKQ